MRIYVQPNYIQTFVTVACDSLPKQVEGQKKTNTRQLPPPKKKEEITNSCDTAKTALSLLCATQHIIRSNTQ
jgi:hypothetical protein